MAKGLLARERTVTARGGASPSCGKPAFALSLLTSQGEAVFAVDLQGRAGVDNG